MKLLEGTCSLRWSTSLGLCIAVFLGLGAGPAVSQSDPAAVTHAIDDSRIANAVAAHLIGNEEIASHLVDVKVGDGVVTLEGTVNNLLAKERATEIAETVQGVRAVVNNTNVRTPKRSDEEIAEDVRETIMLDPTAESYEINVTAFDGLVSLTGEVDSYQEKVFAEDLAKSVRGVTGTDNDITVEPSEDRTDFAIKQDVGARFESDVRLDAGLIEITVNDGAVTLTGSVGSAAEKRRAITEAWVTGVTAVNGEKLKIEGWGRDAMQRAQEPTITSDEDVEAAVADALLYDPRVPAEAVSVDANSGMVTLTGTVNNLRARRAAEEDARNTVGVWEVDNYIRVRPLAMVPNDSLANSVRRALARSPYVESYSIDVRALNGQVFLDGEVHNSFEKDHAGDVVSTVDGVVTVTNNIDYSHEWEWKSDWALERAVNSELFWTPYVDTADVSVNAEDGIVTLRGEVHTWSQRLEAEKAAFAAGARDVRNRLSVEYFPDPSYVDRDEASE